MDGRRSRSKRPGERKAFQLLGDLAYTELRKSINERKLQPGERLREVELAERLGVSRTPVREAIKRLEAEGLIQFAPLRGFVVAELSRRQVMELYAMREVLEGAAAGFAAEQASPVEIKLLGELFAHLKSATTPDEAVTATRRLHQLICEAAHNEYLTKGMNALQDALALLAPNTYVSPGRLEASIRENQKIVRAIAARDVTAAEQAAREHIRAAGAARLSAMLES